MVKIGDITVRAKVADQKGEITVVSYEIKFNKSDENDTTSHNIWKLMYSFFYKTWIKYILFSPSKNLSLDTFLLYRGYKFGTVSKYRHTFSS